ncbi:Gfo/Idh/MocA family oxidoreductase [Litorilinea aerophila]|nr:Gfo/Idh/MocA family oxidoreductase [Litorilinea aerophila]MCC9074987.1 Gfo/Idh/MocA family oxidoreductase [Litorilinea aerophila]
MAQLRFGLVGAGGNQVGSARGLSHARHLATLDAGQIVAVCDRVAEAAEQAAGRLGAVAYTDYDRFLRHGLDVVILATPDVLHAQQAVEALQRGIAVLSEVPAATTVEDGRRLAQAVHRSGGFYMLLENYGYRDEIELIRRLVQAGKLGDVYFGEGEYLHDCRGLNRFPDGSLTWRGQYFSGYVYIWHSLRPLLYILDDRTTRVTAMMTMQPGRLEADIRIPDNVVSLFQTAGGRLLKIRVDIVSPRPHLMDYYALQGTKGSFEGSRGFGDPPRIWLEELEPADRPGRSGPSVSWRRLADFEEEYIPDRVAAREVAKRTGHGGSDYWTLKAFVEAYRAGNPSPVDVFRALDCSLPGPLVLESARRGGAPVEIPDPRTFI